MKRSNNPRNLHEGHFTAHVGLYSKFNVFISFYQDSVDKLYRQVSEGNETADRIAMPVLFMMRHTLELGYKYTISKICELNGTTYDTKRDKHYLRSLHTRLKQEFEVLYKNGAVSNGKKTGFDQHYETTRHTMEWFDKIDPKGENFRYPNFDRTKTINLLEVKNSFDEAMVLLNVAVDVITDGMET